MNVQYTQVRASMKLARIIAHLSKHLTDLWRGDEVSVSTEHILRHVVTLYNITSMQTYHT